MRIFATGKSGTIGKYLPEEVIGIDFRKDPFQSKKIDRMMADPFNLIHLAGVVGENRVLQDINESRRSNVGKTIELAKYSQKKRLNKFFFISTSHVYSKSRESISENTPLNPVTEYSKQKLETENALKSIFRDTPEKLCILRVFSVLSINSREFSLGAAIRGAAANSSSKIFNVDDERDFLHPRQIAEIILKLTVVDDLPQVLNICSGTTISVRMGIEKILTHNNISIEPEQLVSGNSENPRILGDANLLRSLLKLEKIEYRCHD